MYTPDRRLFDLQLKTDLTLVEENSIIPLYLLPSFSREIVFCVYDRSIDIVSLNPEEHYKHRVFKQANSCQIQSVYVWEDLLFYTDLYSVWLCYPALHDREPAKIRLASIYPVGNDPVLANLLR